MKFIKKIQIKNKGNFFKKNIFLLITVFFTVVFLVGIMISENFVTENNRKINDITNGENEYFYIISEKMINEVVSQIKSIVMIDEVDWIFRDFQADSYYRTIASLVHGRLKNIYELNPNIDSIYLYSKYRDEVVTNQGTVFYKVFQDFSWKEEYLNSNKTEFKIYFRENAKSENVLTFLYNIKSEKSRDGCVVINVDIEKSISVMKSSGAFVIAQEGSDEIICMKNDGNFPVSKELIKIKSDSGIVKVSGQYYSISKKASQFGKYYYAHIRLLSDYRKDITIIFIRISIILIFIMLIFMYIAFKISDIMYKPVKELSEFIENPDSQRTKKYLENDINTKKIAEKLFSVVYRNELLCRELNEMMDNFNYAHLKALQWQINPHFIFNTLNLLYLMSKDSGAENKNVSSGIVSLSKLMRYSLNTNPMVVPLSDELESVAEYVKIMSLRLGDSFDFEIISEERFYKSPVIKMCIQPILENSFRHGIKNLNKRGVIKVIISEENTCLKIEITDNGYGISEEKLHQLREKLEGKFELTEAHIGLQNVNNRLKILYGDNYSIKIESKESYGTKVTIKCPEKIEIKH